MTCLVGHPSIEATTSCNRYNETILQTDTSQETPSHRAPLDTTTSVTLDTHADTD